MPSAYLSVTELSGRSQHKLRKQFVAVHTHNKPLTLAKRSRERRARTAKDDGGREKRRRRKARRATSHFKEEKAEREGGRRPEPADAERLKVMRRASEAGAQRGGRGRATEGKALEVEPRRAEERRGAGRGARTGGVKASTPTARAGERARLEYTQSIFKIKRAAQKQLQ